MNKTNNLSWTMQVDLKGSSWNSKGKRKNKQKQLQGI
jgi:hypothetical protein